MINTKPIIYLAGPMSSKPDYNRSAFALAAATLRHEGYEVNNPSEIDGGSTDKSWEFYMKRAIMLLLKSDEVWLLSDWEESQGACIEARIALILGMTVRNANDRSVMNHYLLNCSLESSSEFIAGKVHPAAALKPFSETICQEADRLVSCDRQETYGHPFHDFTKTGKIWAAIFGIPEVTPEQVALCMVGVKISRECNKHKRDNLVDGAGYFKCLDLIHEYRDKHKEKD